MAPWWWSWLLTGIGLTGIWLQGDKQKRGWLLGIGVQVLWVVYGVTTEQYGFIVSAVVYAAFYGRNYWKWRTGR
jgi:hypothetical protein